MRDLFLILLTIFSLRETYARSLPINYDVNDPATDALGRKITSYIEVGGPKDKYVRI